MTGRSDTGVSDLARRAGWQDAAKCSLHRAFPGGSRDAG